MRLLELLLESFDSALEWQIDDPLLADHQPPADVGPSWTSPQTQID